jgi:hypothetical protein
MSNWGDVGIDNVRVTSGDTLYKQLGRGMQNSVDSRSLRTRLEDELRIHEAGVERYRKLLQHLDITPNLEELIKEFNGIL